MVRRRVAAVRRAPRAKPGTPSALYQRTVNLRRSQRTISYDRRKGINTKTLNRLLKRYNVAVRPPRSIRSKTERMTRSEGYIKYRKFRRLQSMLPVL